MVPEKMLVCFMEKLLFMEEVLSVKRDLMVGLTMNRNDTASPRSPVSPSNNRNLQDLLVELSRPNPQASAQAAKEFRSLRRQDCEGEPIRQALRLWASVQGSPEGLQDELRRLTPAHGFWLEHSRSAPLGFARLMLETARGECFDGNGAGLESIHRAQDYLKLKALEELDPCRLRHLQALAAAYLADALRALGSHHEARKCLVDAYSGLDTGAAAEIRATVVQIDADLLRDEGAVSQAKRRLDQAAEVLSRDRMPGRWSELQLARGRLHLFDQEADLALPLLQDARRHCPEDRTLGTRLEVLHCLAAVEASLRNYEDAEEHLEEARAFQSYGNPELHGQRLWLLGHIALKTGRPDEAEEPFQQSFSILRSLGRWSDAAKVLTDLTEVYLITGRLVEKTPEILNLYSGMAHTDELGRQARAKLERLRQGLADRGIKVPELDSYIESRGRLGDPLIN